jgi:hypothetical protein
MEKTARHSLKSGVFTFGRNNPPTVGHEKLFDKTVEEAKKRGTVAHIYTSHSQDAKKNPLTAEHKIALIAHAYPEAKVGSSSKEMPSMLHIAQHLHKQGFQHLVMVAGSDRVDEYHQKLHQYNGTHPSAMYNFKSIKVVSAGQRDPDAEGAAGMSGTKLRAHAAAGEKEKFKSGLLSKLSDEHKEQVYNAVRKSMKVQEIYDPHLKVSKYQWGEKKGTDKMKDITPGEKNNKLKETFMKIPYLLMNNDQKMQLIEQNMQLEFDGIQTRSLDACPGAYKMFKKHIEDLRAGKHLGEITGHETPTAQTTPTSDTQRQVAAGIAMKPQTMRHMQFKQYTGL